MAALSLSISSCAGVKIADSEWCGSLASKGAACFHTLTEESKTMTLQEFAVWWNDLKDPKIATRASTFADFKADLEELCSFNNVCSYEVEDKIDELSQKLETVVAKAKKALPK